MTEKNTGNNQSEKIPYTCTLAYTREHCRKCVCSACYLQEFCDRCEDCHDQSRLKERCNAFEGALTY